MMDDMYYYEKLREHVGFESKETIWDNAKHIYEQCYNKKYLNAFSNQQEFAEYLGVTKGRISQYRYAYEYYLSYKNKFDLRSFSVEQVYTFYRTIGSRLPDFFKWVEENKKISWETINFKETKIIIEEYRNLVKNAKGNEVLDDICNVKLTEKEKKIILFYRNGTDEQRAIIDEIISKM